MIDKNQNEMGVEAELKAHRNAIDAIDKALIELLVNRF